VTPYRAVVATSALTVVAALAAIAVGVVASVLSAAAAVALVVALLMLRREHALRETVRLRAARRRAAAAELEHRRLADELRDRVVQDLAAVGYAIGGTQHDPALAERLAQLVQGSIRTLRQVLVDVQPPALTGATLAPAVADLTAPLRLAGTVCLVRVPEDLPVAPVAATLLYRAAREALHGVGQRSGVGRVEVTAEAGTDSVTLTVTDDGVGADADTPGLALVRYALEEAGGRLTSVTGAGGGTTVTVAVPRESSGGVEPVARTPVP
jgi:signal transduction histidine kinase